MEKLNKIKKFLDSDLNIKKIPDSSRNGLQVKGKYDVKKIGFTVDASLATFNLAKYAKCDMLIVHHGIKWGPIAKKPKEYKELVRKIENSFRKNNISLYGVHLPLDLHNQYGNNIELCKILNLGNIKVFGAYHRVKVGYSGLLKKSKTINQVANILNQKLKTKCQLLNFGKSQIKSIGIVSGGGSDALEEAISEKLDCFITGETRLDVFNRARDLKINMIVAGHYATETVGVKALMKVIQDKFAVDTVFLDIKTEI